MHRTACVDIPALPLQLLLRRQAASHEKGGRGELDGWKQPVAVVDRDHPQGRILWVDERARAQRVLPGLRYAAALSLCSSLRAGVVSDETIERATDAIVRLFWRFSPHVEPNRALGSEGSFWLDVRGLVGASSGVSSGASSGALFPSFCHWASALRTALARRCLAASVVVGFRKFDTFAVARSLAKERESAARIVIFDGPEEEREAASRVPLERLSVDPKALGLLDKLGVRRVSELLRLPAEGVQRRFGDEVWQLFRLARGDLEEPLEPCRPEAPVEQEIQLGYSERDASRLLLVIEEGLPSLFEALAQRGEALSQVEVTLFLESGRRHLERLRTAAPTFDTAQVRDLLRLRFESLPIFLSAGKGFADAVTDLLLRVEGSPVDSRQLEFFQRRSARDLRALARALARLRAEFGESSVVRARPRDGHLPEAEFTWERLEKIREGVMNDEASPVVLVRRLYETPIPLPPRPRHEPDGWMLRGLEQGPVAQVLGPYIVSGGWWRRRIYREYHFAETQQGEILWVYYDRVRRRWFIQGRLE